MFITQLTAEVCNFFQRGGDVHRFDVNVIGDHEGPGGEVEDSLDAGLNEPGGDFLGGVDGDRDDGTTDGLLTYDGFEIVQRVTATAMDDTVDLVGVCIESRYDTEFRTTAFEVRENGATKFADADQSDPVAVRIVES